MPDLKTAQFVHAIRQIARPLNGTREDFTPLLKRIGNKRFVLLGEASHGTHEFYEIRARLTRRLIEEQGFSAVIVESDWPDAYRVNRYVRGESHDKTAQEALSGYKRFPSWMWRNTVVLGFIDWLKKWNDRQAESIAKTGFYGMDLYSLYASMEAVVKYLEEVDPPAAKLARYRYSCFEQFLDDPQFYGYSSYFGLSQTCEQKVVEQLMALQRNAARYTLGQGAMSRDDYFFAEQNARVIQNAEAYYRSMFDSHVRSWNLRDQHMVGTIAALAEHLSERIGQPAKVVVWAHNSHLGDARATDMGQYRQEHNVGQLMRERYGAEVFNVGFTTDYGTVTAASDWESPMQRKRILPGLQGSYEEIFHQVGIPHFLLIPEESLEVRDGLSKPRLERAIGVIYLPESERQSHYFYANLADQFDAVIHIDESRALEPLDTTAVWHRGEEETYPFAV